MGGTTCLRLLVQYGLIRVIVVSSCQGSPYVATLLAAVEEDLRWTGGVGQVGPPESLSSPLLLVCARAGAAGAGAADSGDHALRPNNDMNSS